VGPQTILWASRQLLHSLNFLRSPDPGESIQQDLKVWFRLLFRATETTQQRAIEEYTPHWGMWSARISLPAALLQAELEPLLE